MKKGKWMRFGMGLCLLVSILFLPGTKTGECYCNDYLAGDLGFLEVHNETPYSITVSLHSRKEGNNAGPFYILSNKFTSFETEYGRGKLTIHIFIPPDSENNTVFYDTIDVDVPPDFNTQIVDITTPKGYVPIKK
jgi:hypothetical protein